MRENNDTPKDSIHEERVSLLEKVVEEDFIKAIETNGELTDKELTTCYKKAFTTVAKQIDQNNFDLVILKSRFSKILDELIFDIQILKEIKENRNSVSEILNHEKDYFIKLIPKELYEEGLLNEVFNSFSNYLNHQLEIKKLNSISSTLQKKFLSIYNQTLATDALLKFGNEDSQWISFVKKLERSKNGMLLKFGKFKHGVNGITIHDVFNDAVSKLEQNLKLNKFNNHSTIETYFERIFLNTCLDTLRKNKTKEIPLEDEIGIVSKSDSGQNPQNKIELRELVHELKNQFEKAIKSLDQKCKKILPLVARQFDNFRIMKAMGWTDETKAKTKKSNCLKGLKEKMPILKGTVEHMKEVLIMFYNQEL